MEWLLTILGALGGIVGMIGVLVVVLLILDKRDERYWQRKNDELDARMVGELTKINDQMRSVSRRLTSRWN